jgi:GT2 family glycosyltransferase
MDFSQTVEMYVQDAVRLVLWRHAGNLVKKPDLAVDDRPLPKPYLGTPVSDAVAAFLALADGPAPKSAMSLSIKDEAGQPIFRSDQVRARPLRELLEGLADPVAYDRLLARVLRHGPEKLAGWTDQLTDALAEMQRPLDRRHAASIARLAGLTGTVERIEDGKIVGWALDPRRPFLTLDIDVYRNGQRISTIKADRYRPELKTDRAASAHHGFELDPNVLPADDGLSLYEFRYSGSAVHLTGSPCRLVAGELVREIPVDRPNVPTPDRVEDPSPTATEVCRLQGAIDFIDGRRVTGWAFDSSNPSKVLSLQFEVNGEPAGTAVADELRDDLEFLGGETHHGFHVLLRKDTLAAPWRELHRLGIRDLSSGRLLLDGYPLRYRPDQDERESGAFARRIQRLEQTLLELQEQVPHVRRRTAYSLEDYDLWYQRVHQAALQHQVPATQGSISDGLLPHISVVVPLTAQCPLVGFQNILDSLARQGESGHQYLLVNRSQNDQVYALLAHSYSRKIANLRWIDVREQSAPTFLRSILCYAANPQILLLRPGESLGPDALAWFARGSAKTQARVQYADSDYVDACGTHRDPELRPDFNPDLLRSTPYIGSVCLDRELLESLAADVADEPEGVWQFDLLLRAAERIEPRHWLHISRVLTHRLSPDTGAQGDEQTLFRALSVLRAHIDRCGAPAQADIDDALYLSNPEIPRTPGTFAARLRWQVPDPAPKVSIIIPTRDAPELVRTCIESIRERTQYPDYEILLVDHESTDPEAQRYFDALCRQPDVQVLRYTGAFNWSAMNNFAAPHASGAVLCFLNNDTEVLTPDWLQELVGHACRSEVGAVGAKLLFRDGTLQHGGVILGANGIAEHPFTGLAADRAGYMMRAGLTQNISAVTGACLVCRREIFQAAGGFEMVNLGVAFNDVDFCLRLSEAGYRNVWTPYARLYHEGSKTRGRDGAADKRGRLDKEMHYMRNRWSQVLQRDPNYNPAFEQHDYPYAVLTAAAYSPFREGEKLAEFQRQPVGYE